MIWNLVKSCKEMYRRHLYESPALPIPAIWIPVGWRHAALQPCLALPCPALPCLALPCPASGFGVTYGYGQRSSDVSAAVKRSFPQIRRIGGCRSAEAEAINLEGPWRTGIVATWPIYSASRLRRSETLNRASERSLSYGIPSWNPHVLGQAGQGSAVSGWRLSLACRDSLGSNWRDCAVSTNV
jgi:hypothetical protein